MRTVAERLKFLREAGELSARQAADLAGLASPGHWASVERGEFSPSSKTSVAIAAAFGVSLEWLAAGTGIAPSVRRIKRAVSSQ